VTVALYAVPANSCEQFLKNNDIPAVDYNDLQSFKEFAERRNAQLQKMLGDAPSDIKQSEDHYTNREGTKMRVKVYQPTEPPSTGSPLIVMFHGECRLSLPGLSFKSQHGTHSQDHV